MLTLVLALFCTMPSNTERESILRDAMAMEGLNVHKAHSESELLDMAAEYGFDIEHSEFSDAESGGFMSVHECY